MSKIVASNGLEEEVFMIAVCIKSMEDLSRSLTNRGVTTESPSGLF